ncbi:MAG: rhombosortase [Pseudomonadota bacterium]|jgi:rhomboid family GlyGly-CTERM serine protease|uniref:Rhombosortase n=1 Tax=Thiothrix fructosivorans TaxID=111770 RepID=A0A8B0SK27_9GAMM|nr:rhombosortase [Thiothrix fructosivorans]MBO0614096.1 rhombosortase [Thiothrix fructosivorans]QTX12583.1 rhombosortase [Thiothrix fructosivorans]
MLHTRESNALHGKCTNTCVIAIVFTVLLPLLQFFHDQLLYQRYLIGAGEVWRLWTGNVVHTNHWHLLLNLAGLWLLVFIAPSPERKHIQLLQIGWLATCVGTGLWFMSTGVIWYMGFSGILYGLFILSGIRLLLQGDWLIATVFLVGIGGKTLLDWAQGGASPSAAFIEAPVIYAAHLYGMMGGILLSIPALRAHWQRT